jgi:hypothetical protein
LVVKGAVGGVGVGYDLDLLQDGLGGAPQSRGPLRFAFGGGERRQPLQVVGDVGAVPDLGREEQTLPEKLPRAVEVAVGPGYRRERR